MNKPFLLDIEVHPDSRGTLLSCALDKIPFLVKRIFTISVNQDKTTRGGHSHIKCWQAFMTIAGQVEILSIDTKGTENSFVLTPGSCLVLPPKNWSELIFISKYTHSLVLASHKYDAQDYIYERPTSHISFNK